MCYTPDYFVCVMGLELDYIVSVLAGLHPAKLQFFAKISSDGATCTSSLYKAAQPPVGLKYMVNKITLN